MHVVRGKHWKLTQYIYKTEKNLIEEEMTKDPSYSHQTNPQEKPKGIQDGENLNDLIKRL